MCNKKLLLAGTNKALQLCTAPHESRDLPQKHTMVSSCGGAPWLHQEKLQNVWTVRLHLLALWWKGKLCGIIYGVDDMQVLCKAYSSEYPPFSRKMDKLHN